MAVVRCYSILPPSPRTYASEKHVYILHRDADGDRVREEYPIMSREEMFTQIREFLLGRGERIIGISQDGGRFEIFTEPTLPEMHRDTRSTTAVEQEYLAGGLGMG